MKVGRIIAINYGELKVRIATDIRGNSVNIRGTVYYFGNIGNYLKVSNAVNESIVCEVTSILDSDPNKNTQSFNMESERDLLLKPIGTLKDGEFSLGVGIYPSLYSDVSILLFEDMRNILKGKEDEGAQNNNVYETTSGDEEIHETFKLGTSKSLINYPIDININNFFKIHSAVLGNSGSGKSNTIAHILQEIMTKQGYKANGAKIILFDTNGEYKQAFRPKNKEKNKESGLNIIHYQPKLQGDNKDDVQNGEVNPEDKNGKIETKNFYLPHFLLNLDEWCDFLIATEATQRPFWRRVLQESYRFYALGEEREPQNNSPNQKKLIHYFLHRICTMCYNVLSQVDSDTSMLTTASGVIGQILILMETENLLQQVLEEENEEFQGLEFDYLKKIGKEAGTDSQKLESGSIKEILSKLRITTHVEFGDNKDHLEKALKKIQNKINQNYVEEVLNHKYREGAYYSYKYLKISAEICLIEEGARGSKNMRNWTSTMMTRLDYFLENSDCAFMRASPKEEKTADEYLKKYFSLNQDTNPQGEDTNQIIIIDTSSLSPDVLEIFTSVVTRLIFDYRRNAPSRNKNPIHLILDEAHRYVKKDHSYLLKENIFEKVAREGRKYAYYLLISSQRPSELSETVLSQCGNYIVHRIQNKTDMNYIEAVMPFFSSDLGSKIRQSVPGEAMVFGYCVPMPLQIKVIKASPAPESEDCDISKEWFKA